MVTYSHSRIGTFENCPLQFKFAYVDSIKRYKDSIEAFLGSRCHEVFEKLYKDKMRGKENSLDELLAYFEDIWQNKWNDNVEIVNKDYTEEHYKNVGRRAVEDYYKRHYPFEDGKTVGIEKMVNVTLQGSDGQEHKLVGYIDRLVEVSDGEYEIHDYKSSNSIPDQSKFDEDRQLALYQIAVEQLWPGCKKVHLVWHYLVFDKEIRSYRTAEQIKALKQEISSKIELIEDTVDNGQFEANESALCNWCNYPDLCPKRKHLVEVEKLPENEYLKEDGVVLVNKLAQLSIDFKASKTAYETEKQKIEEALVAYAKSNGYETVAGSDYKAKIKTEFKSLFPRSGEPDRAALDELVKKIGLWDSVSALNTSKLGKVLNSGEINANNKAAIEEFVSTEEKTSIGLSKL